MWSFDNNVICFQVCVKCNLWISISSLQVLQHPAGSAAFKDLLSILDERKKNKHMESSWGGKRSVAVCCCPWYWNQPAAHPVTTAIHAAFTLSRPLRCVTVYNGDCLFMCQHVAGDYQTQLVAHICVSDLKKKKSISPTLSASDVTKERPHCINMSCVLVIKKKVCCCQIKHREVLVLKTTTLCFKYK